MNTPETHLAARSAAPEAGKPCDTCGGPVASRRKWARFCSTRCRNAFHGSENRVEAIKARALPMYQALAEIARIGCSTNVENCWCGYCIAKGAIKDLKPPVEPKDLLKP